MRARGFFIFVVLNVLITAGVAFVVVSMLGSAPTETSESPAGFATVLLIITASPDPNTTPVVRIITATPEPGTIASIPTGVLDPLNTPVVAAPGSTESAQAAPTEAPTINPALAGDPNAQATINALPAGCILHVLAEGESPGRLAEIYDTNVFSILEVNGLTEDDARFLQIGESLIVPLEGCALLGTTPVPGGANDSTAGATATLAPGVTPEPTLTPTVTLAPTAENAQVEVDEVLGAGDITSEHLVIINRGATVNLTGWTLRDLDGNVYTFPETRLFNDGLLEVWTQVGENTPLRRYWNLTRPVWGDPGDVITLEDATGAVQATLRISGD